ncbi:MAG: hypothetical protein EOO48_09580 [Flavobacterium sp.]|nr:MAG: hypothetical protein EOO48_09580 [Flavobacterium sp.]
MKTMINNLIYSILLLATIGAESQVTFESLIINAKKSELPYNSFSKSADSTMARVLDGQQKQYVLSKLRTAEQLIVFDKQYPQIGSPDCRNCLDSASNDEIALITYFKWGNDFLVYLTLDQDHKKRGILASVSTKGEWISWFVSDISLWANDIINLSRVTEIDESGNININENYFDGKNERHSHQAMLISGRTPEGKYISFGKFYITTKTN